MGYNVVTRLNDTHSTLVRYTEWVEYNSTTNVPNWSRLHGVELYNRTADPAEDWNMGMPLASSVGYCVGAGGAKVAPCAHVFCTPRSETLTCGAQAHLQGALWAARMEIARMQRTPEVVVI